MIFGTGRRSWRSAWPKPGSKVGRIALWLSTIAVICLLCRAVLGQRHGSAFMDLAGLCLWLDSLFLLILLIRWVNRKVLWKVRNRLIVTYLLMGLAPLVLFATLIAIIGYGLAGQYSINSALSSLDEAAGQLKGETADVAGILVMPSSKPDKGDLHFEENSNPREADIALAQWENGHWHTVKLASKRGETPDSPFEALEKPAWLAPGVRKIAVLNGKLYLCQEAVLKEENTSADVIGSFELDNRALDSMASSLGRMLIFAGFSSFGHMDIDGAETQAKTAEQEADQAEQQKQKAQEARERYAQERADRQEAKSDTDEDLRQARKEVDQARAELHNALTAASPSADDEQEARQDLNAAQQGLQHVVQRAVQQAQKQAHEATQGAGQRTRTSPSPPLTTPAPKPRAKAPSQEHLRGRMKTGVPDAASSKVDDHNGFPAVSGGTVPPAKHLFDQRVYFTAPFAVLDWADGHPISAMLVVISRPTLLYTRLFATSVDMGSILRDVLFALAIFFAVLEALALWMAIRLSRTITRSVAGLYRGTTEIDGGNLAYRVKPERQDQLGALANSFNAMAGSIEDLLVQQREKERLLSELAIAQEVQGNLFPHSPVSRPGMDLHAVCLPARSVSGDYFDFIFEHGRSICVALGDISGKGISAALLMASLHSAVRAFSLGDDSPLPSPAHLLSLLNQHLYTSTQANKYATLFLAFYHPESRRLTYANGGHLPPFLLSVDGSVQRLEAGGSVVGLLDGMRYEEATVELQAGDLLAIFSDGLTEPEQNGVEFGEERLLDLLRRNRTEPLPLIVGETFKVLREWIGTEEQPDDMTLLLARQL